MIKLNIGSGQIPKSSIFAKDWVNVDKDYDDTKPEWQNANYAGFDLRGYWRFDSDSVDCIFASHILEHISYDLIKDIFREAYRVLKIGSPMRIICPDPRIFWRNWKAENTQFILDCYGKENWDRNKYETLQHIGYTDMFFGDNYDHCLCTSIEYIAICAIRSKFSIVQEMGCGNTMFPQYFREVEDLVNLNSFDNRPYMSWFLECVK